MGTSICRCCRISRSPCTAPPARRRGPPRSWRHSSSSQCVWAQTLPEVACRNRQSERATPHANSDLEALGSLGSQTAHTDYKVLRCNGRPFGRLDRAINWLVTGAKSLAMTISAIKSGKSTEKNQCFLSWLSSLRLVSDFFGFRLLSMTPNFKCINGSNSILRVEINDCGGCLSTGYGKCL